MEKLILKKNYIPKLSVRETERAMKLVRAGFEKYLSHALNLEKISSPIVVTKESGINDNLSGKERIVSFPVAAMPNKTGEVVQSLAKWKRFALEKYQFQPGEGIYTNMSALRCDEDLDSKHSLYVDQWDWEMVITDSDRNLEFLKKIVTKIAAAVYDTLEDLKKAFPVIKLKLKKEVTFITAQELENIYPKLTPDEREYEYSKLHGTIFVMQIGDTLKSGIVHSARASDYDDWKLNGDLIYYNETIDSAFELSSMGIRVNAQSLDYQLIKCNNDDRRKFPYHQRILNNEMVLTIGGGIGQSRLTMLLLEKLHIGEVQVSIWPEDMVIACNEHGIKLL